MDGFSLHLTLLYKIGLGTLNPNITPPTAAMPHMRSHSWERNGEHMQFLRQCRQVFALSLLHSPVFRVCMSISVADGPRVRVILGGSASRLRR